MIDEARLKTETRVCVVCPVCEGRTAIPLPGQFVACCYFCMGRGYSPLNPGVTEADYLKNHPGLPSLADALNQQRASP